MKGLPSVSTLAGRSISSGARRYVFAPSKREQLVGASKAHSGPQKSFIGGFQYPGSAFSKG
jgi:hypothetical protein